LIHDTCMVQEQLCSRLVSDSLTGHCEHLTWTPSIWGWRWINYAGHLAHPASYKQRCSVDPCVRCHVWKFYISVLCLIHIWVVSLQSHSKVTPLTFQSLVVNLPTTRWCSHCIYMFRMDLTTNSNFWLIQH
jgi:hypothetical protein